MAENIAINLVWFSEIIYEILLTSNPQVYGKSSKHEFQERIGGIVAAAHEPPMSRQKPASHQICSPVNISKSEEIKRFNQRDKFKVLLTLI